MDSKILTSLTLRNLVCLDKKSHQLKDAALLFLNQVHQTSVDFSSIPAEIIQQSNFDNIINYYTEEFKKVDFIAELSYLTTVQGGRETPAKSGYRPQIKFDFSELQTSGQQLFIDREMVFPGEKVEAKIKILSPDYFAAALTKGMKFEFREGQKIIGTGEITYIVNDKLEKTDE